MEEKIIEKKTVKRNRPITYSFRVSERERRIIDEKVKTSGLSRTDFLIRALTDKPVVVFERSGEILQELKRQGNNLNQAVRNCYFYLMRKSKSCPLRQSVKERTALCSPLSGETDMPLLAVAAGRAMPDMAIGYITRKDKARYIDVQNLFEDEDYSEQFKETAARFGKYTDYGERKYYHFKLSPDRKDKADPLMVQEYAKACAEKMFPDCECVIATHTDTQTVHSHIVVNAVHPITGKKLHFNDADYTRLKDLANEIGEEFGFSSLDFRKKAENNRTQDEQHIILKGGISWKEELREVIEEGRQAATTPEEFEEHLKLYGVEITRSGKDYSYLHPIQTKADPRQAARRELFKGGDRTFHWRERTRAERPRRLCDCRK